VSTCDSPILQRDPVQHGQQNLFTFPRLLSAATTALSYRPTLTQLWPIGCAGRIIRALPQRKHDGGVQLSTSALFIFQFKFVGLESGKFGLQIELVQVQLGVHYGNIPSGRLRMMEMMMMCDKVEFELPTGRRWKDDCERTENLLTTT